MAENGQGGSDLTSESDSENGFGEDSTINTSEEETSAKLRTPSGTIITKKVNRIKNLFSGEDLDQISESDSATPGNHPSGTYTTVKDSEVKGAIKRKRESPKQQQLAGNHDKSVEKRKKKKKCKNKQSLGSNVTPGCQGKQSSLDDFFNQSALQLTPSSTIMTGNSQEKRCVPTVSDGYKGC